MLTTSGRPLRRIAQLAALSTVAALVVTGADFALAGNARDTARSVTTDDGLPDLDHRFAGVHVTPTAAQLAAAKALGDVQVGWTELGVAQSLRARDFSPLTGPSKAAPDAVARDFLRRNAVLFRQQPADIARLKLTMSDTDPTGATFLRYRQVHGDRVVHGSSMLVALDNQRRVMIAGGNLAPSLGPVTPPVISADDAVRRVAASVRPGAKLAAPARHASRLTGDLATTFHNTLALPGVKARAVEANLVTVPTATGGRTAWRVMAEVAGNADYETIVDATTGEVLYRANQWSSDGPHGLVHTGDDPEAGPQVPDVPFEGRDGSWVWGHTTQSNNVSTYQDLMDDNTADAADRPFNADDHLDYTFTNEWATTGVLPTSGDDRDAVVTQLHYYVNWFHDYAYDLGFTEDARNFQTLNFGRGGVEGDPVHAEVDDKYGTGVEKWCQNSLGDPILCRNNARFGAGGPDGSQPRMVMYVGDDDGRRTQRAMNRDTVIHEYTHGISGRIISDGNLAGSVQSKALGEGWSDALATSIHNDPVYGEYNNGNYETGIRGVDYSNSARRYGDMCNIHPDGCQEHSDGTIWATMMWEMREALVARHGYDAGKALHEQYLVLGMKFTPDTPSFHDARDGYLMADAVAEIAGIPQAGNSCLMWQVFADNRIGVVDIPDNDSDSSVTTSGETPAECSPVAVIAPGLETTEGVDLVLDGTNSVANGDDGDTLSYAWDLDNDGEYDDSTSATPTFDNVGNDGGFPISLQVTNSSGLSATVDAAVTVTNVAPALLDVAHNGPRPEGAGVGVVAKVVDPGFAEDLSLTIDWGDGITDVAESEENARPDATMQAAFTHSYGDNGTYPVELCATDDDTSTCQTLDLVITNVAPTVTIDAAQLANLDEGESLPVLATFHDPGWLDTFPASTVDPGHASLPAGPGDVTITEAEPPFVTGTIAATVAYGDNGTFVATVSLTDDDGGVGSDTVEVTVDNVDPTATIDEAGTVLVNGVPTFFADLGQALPFNGRVQDPGSDDETTTWNWDDGSTSAPAKSRVNPAFDDALPSPELLPRDFSVSDMHAWADACVYNVGFSALDDDAGLGSDSVAVLITGTPTLSRGAGYWQHQYRGNGAISFTPAQLDCYLEIAGFLSTVFNEARDASTRAKAYDDIFVAGLRGDMSQQLDRQLLTAWINFANGGVEYTELLDTNGDLLPDTTFVDVMTTAEAVRLDPAATSAQMQAQRDILTLINQRDGM